MPDESASSPSASSPITSKGSSRSRVYTVSAAGVSVDEPTIKTNVGALPCLFLSAILAAAAVIAVIAATALTTAASALQPRDPRAADRAAAALAASSSDEPGDGARVVRFSRRGAPLTWAAAIDALESGELGPLIDESLRASPHAPALFWETAPLSKESRGALFEMATLRAPRLAGARADPSAFAVQLSAAAPCLATSFPNLGGDATLVVPCPPAAKGQPQQLDAYAHLGAFAEGAPAATRDALWRAVGKAAREAAAKSEPTWISTEGTGVPWLHVRFDRRPKYFHHEPFRRRPPKPDAPRRRMAGI
ncbi:hypothetical protein EMIHUDRAFT_230090 [Emiliania huxleyi CCMP1516]|uniref:Uncharacterized protein n=3 Tax=Emiliania huxleyi TaxID=2903 RepID=A0A0D3KB09_EMIH1|nr:hypothetical protein EMIHUDRAFT_230090 [Emiliania huxleyi CCMP1516]EOD32944.1 hypothetical protein EMIHUDRAFT_230090 [Emiliania huxleyi CCMP1516]|eukprot:XP_005785373.1 hypothetical protein EMIHUDRAFT_230090 [Emiliania huxleyi CCMP1516]